ncbi:MAG: SDR family oxidoreductase [Candidatus Hydrogenedentes bacterium]|nr:SDR family oxidoreductase [Candidatus Hydrogenedentota bacterium]
MTAPTGGVGAQPLGSTMKLTGQNALITGAGRGIGRAIALAFAREGCHVALAARTSSELDAVAEEVRAAGGRALVLPCDVALPESIHATAEHALAALGHIDILVNNAGYACFKPIWTLTLEEWQRSLQVNLTSAFLFCQALVPHMMARRKGRIINMSSVTGLKALPEQAAYCAAKHGLNGWTKSLALELRPYSIAVHALCPGGVDTRFSRDAMPHRDKSGWMQPEDMAETALHLATLSPRVAMDIVSLRRFDGEPLP